MTAITTIEIRDGHKPALQSLRLALDRVHADREIGEAVAKLVQAYFRALPPNKRGFPTTHFWQRAAFATTCTMDFDGPRITVHQVGIRQRFLGGDISPVHARYFTIPAIAQTYGHRAFEFTGLKMCVTRYNDHLVRALAPTSAVRGSNGFVESNSVWFFLLRHVHQEPDENVLPGDDEIRATAHQAVLDHFARIRHGNN